MKAAIMAAAITLLGACSSMPAAAQGAPVCMPRSDILAALKDRHAERPVAMGVTDDGRLIEITAGDGGQTWTILVTAPRGPSCVVADGEAWRQMPRWQPRGPGA